jgi:hypothetical protein
LLINSSLPAAAIGLEDGEGSDSNRSPMLVLPTLWRLMFCCVLPATTLEAALERTWRVRS